MYILGPLRRLIPISTRKKPRKMKRSGLSAAHCVKRIYDPPIIAAMPKRVNSQYLMMIWASG
jgi:hypothetical protein